MCYSTNVRDIVNACTEKVIFKCLFYSGNKNYSMVIVAETMVSIFVKGGNK